MQMQIAHNYGALTSSRPSSKKYCAFSFVLLLGCRGLFSFSFWRMAMEKPQAKPRVFHGVGGAAKRKIEKHPLLCKGGGGGKVGGVSTQLHTPAKIKYNYIIAFQI